MKSLHIEMYTKGMFSDDIVNYYNNLKLPFSTLMYLKYYLFLLWQIISV